MGRATGTHSPAHRPTASTPPLLQLEFVIGGDAAQQPHNIEVEVWDMHWRNSE